MSRYDLQQQLNFGSDDEGSSTRTPTGSRENSPIRGLSFESPKFDSRQKKEFSWPETSISA